MDLNIKEQAGSFFVEIRPLDNFIKGTIRDISLRDGVMATSGTLKQEFQKSIEKRL